MSNISITLGVIHPTDLEAITEVINGFTAHQFDLSKSLCSQVVCGNEIPRRITTMYYHFFFFCYFYFH